MQQRKTFYMIIKWFSLLDLTIISTIMQSGVIKLIMGLLQGITVHYYSQFLLYRSESETQGLTHTHTNQRSVQTAIDQRCDSDCYYSLCKYSTICRYLCYMNQFMLVIDQICKQYTELNTMYNSMSQQYISQLVHSPSAWSPEEIYVQLQAVSH